MYAMKNRSALPYTYGGYDETRFYGSILLCVLTFAHAMKFRTLIQM